MKKTLALLLAALTVIGPLPSYAQSVPQLGAVAAPVGTVGAAGAAVGPSLTAQGPAGVSLTLTQPVLSLGRSVSPAAANRAKAGATALGNAAASSNVAGASQARPIAEPAAFAAPVHEDGAAAPTTIAVARTLAGSFDSKASAAESASRSSYYFDALRRAKSAAAPAAEDEPAPEAKPAAQSPFEQYALPKLRKLGHRVAASAVGRLLPSTVYSALAEPGAEPPAPKQNPNVDEWGGPKSETRTLKGQAFYGLKWAFNLVGITTLLTFTLGPILSLTPWPLFVPDSLLQMTGRVELLTDFGPKEIHQALTNSPLAFMLFKLPLAVALEEWSYRVMSFAPMFFTLAAIKPAARWIAGKLDALPDLYGMLSLGKRLLRRAEGLSRFAFPLAAASSAASFALAHVQMWGFDPFVLLVQAIAGLVLIRTAYVSRGLVAPFVAHLAFNVLTLLSPLLVMNGFFALGAGSALIIGLAGIVSLYYNFRVHQKLKGAKGATALLLAGMIGAQAVMTGGTSVDQASARWLNRPAVVEFQQAAPAPQAPAPQAPAPQNPAAPATPAAPQTPAHEHPDVPEGLPPEIAQMLKEAMGAVFGPSAEVDQTPEMTVPQLVQKSKPAVITVLTKRGLGSGFIVSPEGLLVTNDHVVRSVGPGGMVRIKFANGMIVPAKVLASNQQMDLALVQLPPNPNGWPFVPLAPVGSLVEGQKVVTMGSPLGLPFTVSDGIVSGLGLRGVGISYRIQITAPISHGNSGGPLFDMKGRVIGVNSAGIEQGANLGFAIPVEEVHRAIKQYQTTKEIRSAHMGIVLQVGEQMPQGPGVTIEHVRPGSPAEKAGLLPGDIIAGAEGVRFPPAPMPALNGLYERLGAKNPGEKIKLLVLRPQASGMAAPQVVEVTVDAK
ncbi:MAG: trypsin-like peptidase domain-containing protein [Elusimicrobia bacterium]|nr:trypsin-like peptidase domain-containing protein [Elusimicrobiota bacterium]